MNKHDLKNETMWEIKQGDAIEVLKTIPDQSINTCVTSPPYWGLRDYGIDGQVGIEETPEEYVAKMVEVFREVKRVLRNDGTLWLNLGDSYAGNCSQASNNGRAGFGNPRERLVNRKGKGLKPKDLVGIPWRVALALQADGWYLRSDIIWHKPNPIPESVKDRPTKAHEYIFLLSKSPRYYYDYEAIKEPVTSRQLRPTRNRRSVWTVPTRPFPEAHFATFPPELIEPCVLAGCPIGGVVLDPFVGSGTTLLVATRHHRRSIGIELNPEYIKIAERRLKQIQDDCHHFSDKQEMDLETIFNHESFVFTDKESVPIFKAAMTTTFEELIDNASYGVVNKETIERLTAHKGYIIDDLSAEKFTKASLKYIDRKVQRMLGREEMLR